MCLILVAYEVHPQVRLVLAANRDEFWDRPTAPLDAWDDHPDVVAGRDLKAMGTWMGVNRRGAWAAITNVRDPASVRPNTPSRGRLVADFLTSNVSAPAYAERIRSEADQYNGFNLLVGDPSGIYYVGNRRADPVHRLASGIYGLSNDVLNTPWPKVKTGRQALTELMTSPSDPDPEALFGILRDQTRAADDDLPQTGVPMEWERILSPILIRSPQYGTRASSVLLVGHHGEIRVYERTWMSGEGAPEALETRGFRLCSEGPSMAWQRR